jgi:hypothetical protein
MPTNPVPQSLREKILKEAHVEAGIVRWTGVEGDIKQTSCPIVQIPIDDLMQLFAQEQQSLLERVKVEVINHQSLREIGPDVHIGLQEWGRYIRAGQIGALAAFEEELRGAV